jgi:Na+/melibiose symporter-like transporter
VDLTRRPLRRHELFASSASVPFLVDAVTFRLASVVVSRLPDRYPPSETPEVRASLRADVVEGFRCLWDHRVLRTIALAAAVGNLAFTAGDAVLVLYAQDVLGLGAAAYRVLLAMAAVGGLLGSLAAASFAGRVSTDRLLPVTFLVAGAAQAGMGLTSNPYLVGLLFAAAGSWRCG